MARTDSQRERDRETRRERQSIAWREARASILDIFSSARHFKMTHSAILERLATRRAMPSYRRLTTYQRAQLSGFTDAMWHVIETTCLDWRLTLPDGSWIDAREYPYKTVDCRSYRMLGCHFWKGTDSMYGKPSPMHGDDNS